MKKYLLKLILLASVLLCLTVFASAASVIDSGYCGGEGDGTNLTWTLTDDGLLTIEGTGAMKNYSYNGAPWYANRASVLKVQIGDGVTTVGNAAFYSCTNLAEVTIPDSVITIGDRSFADCNSLTEVTIPDSVTVISDYAFYGCDDLTAVTMGDSVTTICTYAFQYCSNLTAVTFGDSVTSIGTYAFYSCTGLTEVTFCGNAPSIGQNVFYHVTATCYYPADDSTWTASVRKSYGGTLTWVSYEPVKVIDSGYCGCEGDGTNLTWTLTDDGVLTIEGTGAMTNFPYRSAPWYDYRDVIQTVQICDKVTTIGTWAFYNCSKLLAVTIPDGVTTIGYYAFSDCSSLSEVTFPDSVTAIGGHAFFSCDGLTEVTIPANVTTIGDEAFHACHSLTAITVSESNSAYSSANGVLFNEAKTELVQYPIGNARSAYAIPDSVTTIGISAFCYGRSLTVVTIPASVISIKALAFGHCDSLTSVTVPDSVTLIGHGAFNGCTSLTAMTIPASVISIEATAFSSCHNLTEVTFMGNAPTIGKDAFTMVTATCYYPANDTTWTSDVMQNYGGSLTWKGIIASGYCGGEGDGTNLTWTLTEDGVLTIEGTGAMKNYSYNTMPWYANCSLIETVTIGDSVTTIGNYAFDNCSNLTAVTIGDSVTTIGIAAFRDCSSLTAVPIGDSVTTIGIAAFQSCSRLSDVFIKDLSAWCKISFGTSNSNPLYYGADLYLNGELVEVLDIPSDVTEIRACAFYHCSSLTDVTIPDSVTTIGNYAFADCSSLTDVTIGENVTTIDYYAFMYCDSLTAVIIPDSVTTIGYGAFYDCSSLTAVTIPDSVTDIGYQAFSYCYSLTEVTFEGKAPSFGQNVFYGVTATCYYPGNDTTWTTDVMQNYGGTLTWEPYGVAQFSIAGTTMTLGNDLALNFMVLAADVTGEGWYAEIVHGDRVTTISQSDWVRSGDYFRISYKGMAAKEMVDEVVITVYNANGFAVTEPRTDSARAYAMRMFGWRDSFDTVLADMLNYGAAAQQLLNYKTDDLANSLMTDEQKAKATETIVLTDLRQTAAGYQGATLELESNIVLNFFYSAGYIGKTATVSYTDHLGTVHSYDVTVGTNGTLGKVSVDKLVISDCSVPVTVTIDGVSVTDSVESYCARMQGYLELGEPLMKFAASARAYFSN